MHTSPPRTNFCCAGFLIFLSGSRSSGFTSSPGKCTTTFTPASSGKPWELPLMTWSSSISVNILWNASFRMASPSAYLLPSAVILSSLLTCSVCPPLLAVAGIGHTSTTLPTSSAATSQDTTAATTATTSNLRAIAGAILSLQETRQTTPEQEDEEKRRGRLIRGCAEVEELNNVHASD
uniref:Uncharacterized protein n=1 Tax=Oryza meridionalis TaxID=40149 RepID=A0A0E0DRF4_9ORYZ